MCPPSPPQATAGGGGLATLSAFDVAQDLKKNWDTWDRTGWQTQECPKVRLMTYATPRLGNATFVDAFHGLDIAALRIENKGDVVPKVPGGFETMLCLGWMQLRLRRW